MIFLPFIVRRARRHWQILLTLGLGVIIATALLASGPLLVDTVIELSLQRTLQSADVLDSHLRLSTRASVDVTGYDALNAQMGELIQRYFGESVNRTVRSTGSNWMLPWLGGQLVSNQRVNLRFQSDIEDHVEFLAGTWPDDTRTTLQTVSDTGAAATPHVDFPRIIPAVVGDELAQAYALRVGDRLPLSFKQAAEAPDAWIEVTGVVRPRYPSDPYWFGDYSPLTVQSTSRWTAQYSAILPFESFFQTAVALFPRTGIDVVWQVLLSHDTITHDTIVPLRAGLADLTAELRRITPRTMLETGLDNILADFEIQSETVRAPLFVLIAEVVLLALYYVTMAAALSMREVEREFAILRSRGASGWQLVRIQVTEAILITAVAFVSGPLLGSALVQGLSWFGPLADVGQADWALSPTQSAWLAAGAGTLACLAGLLLPLGPGLGRSIVTHQQMVTRSTRRPWWQRFYLDVFVLLGGLILLWRLHLYGELVVGGAGRPRLDWLLLLSPLALLLGSATILLRIFPLILRAMAALAARARGLSGVLAMWQASRNPTHVARLVLLLTLAIALGILTTGLNATLDRSESERARYLAGNDVRLVSKRAISLRDLQSASGVRELSGTWRGEGTVDLKSSRAFPRFEILAIEPYSFAKVTGYRPDYSEVYMGELLGHLVADEGKQPPTLALPGSPAHFEFWLKASVTDDELGASRRYMNGHSDVDRIGLQAKLQTAQGELFTLPLEQAATNQLTDTLANRFVLHMNVDGRESGLRIHIEPYDDGWRRFETSIPILPPSSYPLSLHSLWFQNRARYFDTPMREIFMHLAIDDLTVTDATTQEPTIVEGFENPTRIWFFDSPEMLARFTRSDSRSGEALLGLELSFGDARQSTSLKLTEGRKTDPLPALASPGFLNTTELQVGDTCRVWINSISTDMNIVGTVQYFPTLYEEMDAGFLITSRDLLLPRLNETSRTSVNPNEVFLETDEQTTVDTLVSLVPTLSQSWDAETVRKTIKANPLSLGLRGVTFFGYTLTTLLSLVGFATHFYMSARQRATLYGVMRALGLSPRQLYGSMVLEQVILILTGLALGTALGVLLNQITLPRLPIALGDRPPIPPFYPHEDWMAVGRIYLILAVSFLVSLGVATALLWRARIHRALRIGQE